jgi:hypothetical protein
MQRHASRGGRARRIGRGVICVGKPCGDGRREVVFFNGLPSGSNTVIQIVRRVIFLVLVVGYQLVISVSISVRVLFDLYSIIPPCDSVIVELVRRGKSGI